MRDAIPLHRTPTDLRPLLEGALDVLRDQAQAHDIALVIQGPASLPKVSVDAEKIAWAVTTLVGNAMRFVRKGTRTRPGGCITVRLATEESMVVIAVEDDGPGIPADKVSNLFRRGAGVTHGTGLGLMLVQDVLTAHGGSVDVQSRTEGLDTGTTISLRIPLP